MRRHRRKVSGILLAALACGGCGLFSRQQEQRIIVPDDLLRQSDYAPDGVVPRTRYVVRMSDGRRDWEIEFPEVATGYELRIPLDGDPRLGLGAVDGPRVTAADREIHGDMIRQSASSSSSLGTSPTSDPFAFDSGTEAETQDPWAVWESGDGAMGEGAHRRAEPGGTHAGLSGGDGTSAPPRPRVSYLATVAEVRELFRTRNYEVALVKLVDLEKSYPNDEKLLSMKGTLYRQLGRTALARDAWEQVLRLNPNNEVVLQALEQLNAEHQAGGR